MVSSDHTTPHGHARCPDYAHHHPPQPDNADPGIRFAMATAALVTALLLLSLARMPPAQVTAGLVVVAGCATVGMRLRWQVTVALVAWALLTGFTYGQYGELSFDRPDLARLGLLLLAVPSIARTVAMLHAKDAT